MNCQLAPCSSSVRPCACDNKETVASRSHAVYSMGMSTQQPTFTEWLDTFVQEKELDLDHYFSIESGGFWSVHLIPLQVVIDNIKEVEQNAQALIMHTLVAIDVVNGDVMDYFKFLASALVDAYDAS